VLRYAAIIATLSLIGCAAKPVPTFTAATGQDIAGAQSHVANAQWGVMKLEGQVKAAYRAVLEAVAYSLEQTQIKLAAAQKNNEKTNNDVISLQGEVIKKTQHQIKLTDELKPWRRIKAVWFWLKWGSAIGLVVLLIVANGLPSGVLWGPVAGTFTFIVSIPARFVRLFRKPRKPKTTIEK
jgi:hypothetical protein